MQGSHLQGATLRHRDHQAIQVQLAAAQQERGGPLRPAIKPLTHRHHARPTSRPEHPHLGTPAHAVGLSFSVAPDVHPVPGSLENIFRELHSDLGLPRPSNGDLTPWAEQGLLLLNKALTTAPRRPAAHRGKGWEEVTQQAISALAARGTPLVSVLWGRDARNLRPSLGGSRRSSPRTPPPCRRTAGSSVHGRSAGPMSCWSIRAPSRSTGDCRDGCVRRARPGGDRRPRTAG